MRRSFDMPAEIWAAFDGLVADSDHKRPADALAEMIMERYGEFGRPLVGQVQIRTSSGFAAYRFNAPPSDLTAPLARPEGEDVK